MKKVKNNKGFTLIELLVAIAIITILASVSLVSMSIYREKTRDAKRVSELHSIKDAVELFFVEKGFFPPCIYPQACSESDPDKLYFEKIFGGPVPRDPSGEYYHYDNNYGREEGGGGKYCIGTDVEYIDGTAPCDIPFVAVDEYVIQGP